MNLKTLLSACSIVCDKHIAKNEQAIVRVEDNPILYTDLKAEIEKVKEWCYHDFDTDTIKQIIPCKKCVHYKMCTTCVPGKPKPQVTYRCSFDNEVKQPTHFCGYAKEVEK